MARAQLSAATLAQYHRRARVRVALNNPLMSMQFWGLTGGWTSRGPPSIMEFCTSSLVHCSQTMRGRGDHARQQVLNERTDVSYQFCGYPLDVELWPPQYCEGHLLM